MGLVIFNSLSNFQALNNFFRLMLIFDFFRHFFLPVLSMKCWQCAAVDGRRCPDDAKSVASPGNLFLSTDVFVDIWFFMSKCNLILSAIFVSTWSCFCRLVLFLLHFLSKCNPISTIVCRHVIFFLSRFVYNL